MTKWISSYCLTIHNHCPKTHNCIWCSWEPLYGSWEYGGMTGDFYSPHSPAKEPNGYKWVPHGWEDSADGVLELLSSRSSKIGQNRWREWGLAEIGLACLFHHLCWRWTRNTQVLDLHSTCLLFGTFPSLYEAFLLAIISFLSYKQDNFSHIFVISNLRY